MKKSLICILTVLCLVLALCPVSALAADSTHLIHTPQLTNVKEATETEPGYTGDMVCSVCGAVLLEGFEVPATGGESAEEETVHVHSPVLKDSKEATETEAGYTGDIVCESCGEVLTQGVEIPALSLDLPEQSETAHVHTPTLKDSKEATETEAGYTGDIVCESCGEVLVEGSELAATESESSTQQENPFEDVGTLAYYYEPVLWAYYSGVTTGTTATTFSPHDDCTRAQVVTFLWRAMGQPEPELEGCAFADIDTGAYYYDAVLWAVEQGVTTGTTESTFDPERTCTRGEVVTFLWRSQGEPEPQSSILSFSDVEDGTYYSDAVLWAVEEGITNGYGDGTFRPNRTCNRAEIVTFLYRCFA